MLGPAKGDEPPPSIGGQEVLVATVGGEPIYRTDVDGLLEQVTGGKEVNPAASSVVYAQVLSEIVDRLLVTAYARRTESGPSPTEVEAEIDRLQSKLAAEGRSLDDYLDVQKITERALRRQITWRLVWPKYLARYITEARAQSYFHGHRRQFDGTELSVSHILLQPEGDDGPQVMEALIEKARGVRRAIISGKISFADAARQYSAAPSATEGGRLGFITRYGAMDEAFSQAAFELEVGQLSEPVRTRFGIHLIRCDQIKAGRKTLTDARQQVQEALARELIDKLVRFELRYTPVEFTGAAPYFKPGTRELVDRPRPR